MLKQLIMLRFGLRFLLGITLVLAIAFAWLARWMSEGRHHRYVAKELQAAGCSVEFTHREWVPVVQPPGLKIGGHGTPMESKSTLPEIVEQWGFSDSVRRIRRVTIRAGSDVSAITKLLQGIGEVESLSFYDTGIEEPVLTQLLSRVQVSNLYVQSEPMPRTSIEWLNHDGLKWLCVRRTQFSNPAIDDLPHSLEYFDATRTRINDDGLDSFVRLANLRTLILRRTPTTMSAIDALRQRMPWCEIKWEPLKNP